MGRMRGKLTVRLQIGKVHKIMDANALVFRDHTSSLDELIARVQENPLHLSLDEVTLEEPGHPIAGENWRPQLAPYKPWVHDEALDETEELDGADGDLLIVGALGMGISDEERMAIIGDAVRGGDDETSEPLRALTPHELWTLGQTPRWDPKKASCETSQSREASQSNRETTNSDRETPEEGCGTSSHSRETIETPYFATTVPVQVRRDGEGYALSAVHLSALAEHGLPADELIVVVPASIDGAPVVRIASEAFARRFTSGAHVRLLVVPDTVEVIGAQAFGSVCAEVVHLGAGVRAYDPAPLDMALPNPRLETRRYEVSPANDCLSVQDGCLLERLADGGTRLLCADAPCPEHFTLPEGVRVVGSAAFVKGVPAPHVIDAPSSLQRVDAAVHPETIWRGDDPELLARIVARCGGRVTDFQAIEEQSCWYGFRTSESGVREAHLVAGPPAPDSVSRQFSSAAHARLRGGTALSPREIAAEAAAAMVAPVPTTDRLSLPRTVQGAPLTAIAERALITAPATLAIPDTVRSIADGNACKGTRKLMLAEGLRTIGTHCFCSRTLVGPVLIPASVISIGEGSFEYAIVRLAAADAVVHITSDQLISCFLEDADDGVPFDFARYDDQLLQGRGLPDHLGALLHRVAAPFRLAPDMRDRIVEALAARDAEAMQYVAREGDIAMVRALAAAGFLDDAARFDRQIERLRASNRTDCVLYLMNWRHDRHEAARAIAPTRARDRFAL